MLKKLAVWMSGVPHYVLAFALAVTIWGPKVLPMLTGSPLAAWVPYLTDAIALATGLLALAKQFNPGTPAAVETDRAIVAKSLPLVVPPLPPVTK